jgi:hypothetical protein
LTFVGKIFSDKLFVWKIIKDPPPFIFSDKVARCRGVLEIFDPFSHSAVIAY